MQQFFKKWLEPLLTAILATFAAYVIRLALNPLFETNAPLLVFSLAIVYSAGRCGLFSGALATGLSALLGASLFSEAERQSPAAVLRLALFSAVGLGMSWIAAGIHKSRRLADVRGQKARELEELLEIAKDAIIVRDFTGNILRWNNGAVELYGWSVSEAVQQNIDTLLRTEFAEAQDSILASLRRDNSWEGEIVRMARDGSRLVVETRWVLSRHEDGSVRAILEIDRDATQRRQIDQQMQDLYGSAQAEIAKRQEAEAGLRRSNEDLQMFAYAVSHDLQEPLRTASSFADLLLNRHRADFSGEAAECLEFIGAAVTRMQQLIEDLLEYSRVAHGASESRGSVEMADAWEWALSNLKTAIEDSGAVISNDPLPCVRGDFGRLAQLTQNLLANAIRYRGRATPLIHFSAHKKDQLWLFELRDNGIGIAPEHHERIFGVFKRLHGRGTPGTGIGLAICRKIVDRHGGKLWVESKAGEGATFLFTLPPG